MTSQIFAADETKEEWGDWGDWGENGNNNNHSLKSQIPQHQSLQQMHQQPPPNVAFYSPSGFQQQQPLDPAHQPPPQQYNNQSMFDTPSFHDNANNNQLYQANVNQSNSFNNSLNAGPPTEPYFEKVQTFKSNEGDKGTFPPLYPVQYHTANPPQLKNDYQGTNQAFMPSPSTSPMQLPPPPQAETTANDLYTSNQQKNLPAPPPIQNFDSNFAGHGAEAIRGPFDYNHATWNQNQLVQNTAPVNPIQRFSQAQVQSVMQTQMSSNVRATDNTTVSSAISGVQATAQINPLLAPVTDSFSRGNSSEFFGTTDSIRNESSPTSIQQVQSYSSNLEQPINPSVEYFAVSSRTQQGIADSFHPENREHLEELAARSTATPLSFTDRHNYLVTGQLSQDRSTMPYMGQHQQQMSSYGTNNNTVEALPPPGLSRMVVGQPEHNQEQISTSDVLPPGLNRMVTGTDMSSSNYINYQRQADGEVSQPSMVVQRPQSNSPFGHQSHQQINTDAPQQNFNTSDRNLYLVAGESDINSQRVIPGVESDSSSLNGVLNPLQNLHIQDDGDFVNVSVLVQERNVNVDGMEVTQDNPQQRSIDAELRDEEIDGANDNNDILNVATTHDNAGAGCVSLEKDCDDVREEAIEGANDYNDEAGKSTKNLNLQIAKKKKPENSSEDSELRIEKNKLKSRSRRIQKYAEESNESEIESDGDRKERFSDQKRRPPRHDKMSREDYEASRRKEKERRSGEKPRKGDDTDGSKYGDSKKRTDDEADYRKNREKYKKSSRDKRYEEAELTEKDKKKQDKYREPGSRRKDYNYEEERRERRRRERYYDDDAYSGRRSQNTSDREYQPDRYNRRSRDNAEKERKYDSTSYYQQYPGYDASNYNYSSYYQQQQYYETLRRTNPQAYYEWYTKYIAMMQQAAQARQQQPSLAMDDIGGSLRSGYSSSNEKERASSSRFLPGGDVSNPMHSMNSSFIDNNDYQSMQGFPSGGKDLNQTYSSLNLIQSYGYDNFSRDKKHTSEVQRLTPKKFQSLHSFVKLTNGLMTTVNSDHTVKIENIPIFDKTRRLYQLFPGPLVRGVSHKKSVIEFCEEKLKQDLMIAPVHRTSYSLLWGYLILMLRQNGNYTEADISELLMKNSQDFKATLDSVTEEAKLATNEDNTDESENEENANSEKNSNSNSVSQSQEEETTSGMAGKSVLHKFREFLLYGNINDALDFATENNLWGHALFLASKVDRRQHANVMLKFANKLPYNDPLQTLYQIMSGRMPSCVTNLDDKWGDWRPHLAMIISNCTDKPDLVKKSIMALGDSLASRGDVYGSQFCYLLVEPQFKEYNDSASDIKIALLGSSHLKSFKEFATDDAIIMTEVYEYARSLSEENFFVPSFQKYKLLLAGKMLDYGLQLKCLLYTEQIAKCVVAQSSSFDFNFVSRVFALADRMKYSDPVMEKSYADNYNNNGLDPAENQKWLQDLSSLIQSYSNRDYQPPVEQTPQHSATSDIYNPVSYASSVPSVIYDPLSQHQTPTHAASAYYEGDQTYQDHNQAESFHQYQNQEQHEVQGYSNEYNSPMAIPNSLETTQEFADQVPYDPNSHNSYQQSNAQSDYGYGWEQQSAYQQPQPTITMGNSVSNKFEASPGKVGEKEEKQSTAKKTEEEKNKKQTPQNAGGQGWFGGIFSKLSIKPKNQMILPDDKNPAIVWDEATKKWVNKDGEAVETESFKPPPKMGGMMGNNSMPTLPSMGQTPQTSQIAPTQQMPQISTNSGNSLSASIPSFQPQTGVVTDVAQTISPPPPNMFKMQKGRNLKKSYVDILGATGQTVSQPKDVVPPMEMPFFNPAQQQQQGMQFYNPNDFH